MMHGDQAAPESRVTETAAAAGVGRRIADWTSVLLWVAAGVTVVWIGFLSWVTLYSLSRLFA
jgi:hypothetical protein